MDRFETEPFIEMETTTQVQEEKSAALTYLLLFSMATDAR
jgi:hypothetical protein